MILTAGHNVYPAELERVIAGQRIWFPPQTDIPPAQKIPHQTSLHLSLSAGDVVDEYPILIVAGGMLP